MTYQRTLCQKPFAINSFFIGFVLGIVFEGCNPRGISFAAKMPYSAFKAGARLNWLDRLRSAKGFPVEPGLKIEDFLHSDASQVQSAALSCSVKKTSENYEQERSVQETVPDKSTDRGMVTKSSAVECKNESTSPDEVKAEINVKGEEEGDYLHRSNSKSLNGSRVKAAKKKKKSLSIVKEEASEDWFEMTNNFLAELFGMRDGYMLRILDDKKKRKRKQEKPRLCPSSTNVDANLTSSSPPFSADDNSGENRSPSVTLKSSSPSNNDAILTSSPLGAVGSGAMGAGNAQKSGEIACTKADDAPLKRKGFRKKTSDVDGKGRIGNKKQDSDSHISSYSCTEVTLIDTSIPTWKSQKVIFRKGTIWKVRDKNAPGSVLKSVPDDCIVDAKKRKSAGCLDELHHPKKKGPRSSGSPSSRAVEDKGAECSSIKVHTRKKLHSDHVSSSKDTDVEVRTEVEERKDNIPKSRNSGKRHAYSGSADCCEDASLAEPGRQATEESSEASPQTILSPDHPVNQPMETLLFSIYQVFLQAGKTGLTAREAVSRILERGLPGLHEGGVVPRIEVARILRTSPYFMQLEESKFVLCSAIIGNEGQHLCSPANLMESREEAVADEVHVEDDFRTKENQSGSWQYLAALAAIRRARTRRRSLTLSQSKVGPFLS